jgi:NSS family neurotransmitter:Na+ symporter
LGNVWRFPYIAGEGGGGAFLLVYLALIVLIGIPVLTLEIALGRMSDSRVLQGFGKLAGRPLWNGLGWLGFISCLLIMSFYVMIMAWILIYFVECLSGGIGELQVNAIPEHFELIASNLVLIIAVIIGIMAAALLVVKKGLQAGLERYSKTLMLALIAIVVGLCIWAATLDGSVHGYRWFLMPDFSKIDLQVVLAALGQLFFSVGVGIAVAFVFGSYTHRNENLVISSVWIVWADTFFAILAGLMLFPELIDAPLVFSRRCLYTDTLDGHFWIDNHPEIKGLSVSSGGSGHGLKMAPILGAMTADVVEGKSHEFSERHRWRHLTKDTTQMEEARHVIDRKL